MPIYSPLSKRSFRILELIPSEDVAAELTGELVIHISSENVEYEALSYEWGDTDESGCVIPSEGQLCIDQQDTDEESRQVALMGNIYAGAEQVLVILYACVANRQPANKILELTPMFEMMTERSKQPLKSHVKNSPLTKDPDQILYTQVSIYCDWWMPIWTVRELVYIRRLLCFMHDATISGHELDRFYQRWNIHMQSCCWFKDGMEGMMNLEIYVTVNRAYGMFQLRRRLLRPVAGPTLLEMLARTGGRSVTDLNDNIYALASLTRLPVAMIDYRNTPRENLVKITRYIIQDTGRLDVSRYLNSPIPMPAEQGETGNQEDQRKVVENLPSWAPDWSTLRNGLGQQQLESHHRVLDHYSAGGSTIAQSGPTTEHLLALRGIHCTNVQTVSHTFKYIDPTIPVLTEPFICLKPITTISSLQTEADTQHTTPSPSSPKLPAPLSPQHQHNPQTRPLHLTTLAQSQNPLSIATQTQIFSHLRPSNSPPNYSTKCDNPHS